MFDSYEPLTGMSVEMETSATADVAGRGWNSVSMQCGSEFELRKLEDVLQLASFEYSLISVCAIDKKGMRPSFWGGQCLILEENMTFATESIESLLYVIKGKIVFHQPHGLLSHHSNYGTNKWHMSTDVESPRWLTKRWFVGRSFRIAT